MRYLNVWHKREEGFIFLKVSEGLFFQHSEEGMATLWLWDSMMGTILFMVEEETEKMGWQAKQVQPSKPHTLSDTFSKQGTVPKSFTTSK